MEVINISNKQVIVIGGGIAGLSASLDLANLDIQVVLIEKSDFLGGHGIQYTCKATDRCVKCGACLIETKLNQVIQHPNISTLLSSRIRNVEKQNRFSLSVEQNPQYIDANKCNCCGICVDQCPEQGALQKGYSKNNRPFLAVCKSSCRHLRGDSCTTCQDVCPERAIHLSAEKKTLSIEGDAIIVATGFNVIDPKNKPYGYKRFQNVITNLELERMFRQTGRFQRPSDSKIPKKIGFIQCVGSRDAKLGHLWCSRVCCGSSIRMANKIKHMHPDSEITIFYIDIQSFGKDYSEFIRTVKDKIRWVRTIPADIIEVENNRLQVSYFSSESVEEDYDVIVLSVGLIPRSENENLLHQLDIKIPEIEYSKYFQKGDVSFGNGIFGAGSLTAPMGIADAVTSSSEAVLNAILYLESGNQGSGIGE